MNLRNLVVGNLVYYYYIAIKYSTYSYCYVDYLKKNEVSDDDLKYKIYL